MKGGDERENRIHAESARNGFIAYTAVNFSVWAYNLVYMDQIQWILYFMAFGPFAVFILSMIYYHWKGLENGLSLSNLGSN
ncbi:hypothetical protein ACK3SF_01480 [Candidatus Nanosalina sp. VS9-1]|uniref:hypothetical protein n=1 Tax=Candidatus Nanosalina sp. VS9-1 TaxID=3388566 RepID=UPI0039E1CEF6